MNITEFAVRNVAFTATVLAAAVAVGLFSLNAIPRTEDPYFPLTLFVVTAVYPGADALEMERQVVKPIEDALDEIGEVKEILSDSDDSLGVVRVEFESQVDPGAKYDEITRGIAALRPDLPTGLTRLEVDKVNPGLVNILQVALVSDSASWGRLGDAAEALRDRLERVPGVRESETWAYPERELRVSLDLKRLGELKLTAANVLTAVRADNTNVPGGPVELGERRYNLQTSGAYDTLDEVRDTVIGGGSGRVVRLRDVAAVAWDYQAEEYRARFNGRRAVWVTANQKDGQNIFRTSEKLDQALAEFRTQLPADIEQITGFRQAGNVARRISALSTDLVIAIVLVAFTLLPLGLRAAGVVMISIPLSLMCGLAGLYFTGYSLNQMSIAGFILALGLLVDDSIVVTENIARFLRMGHSRADAAILATRQIALAVLGCTAALLFAFLPLTNVAGNPGKFLESMPVTVFFTIGASMIVSLTLIPFLASRMLSRTETAEGNVFLRALMRGIRALYAPLLGQALARPRSTVAIAMGLVLVSLALLPVIGVSVFPKASASQFLVLISLPKGASLDASDRVLRTVEAELAREPGVTTVMSNLGRGNPQIYYNIFDRDLAANYAEVFAGLEAFDPARTPAMYERLRARFAAIAGAEIVLKEFENGMPTIPLEMRVYGPGLDELRRLAAEVERVMLATPGTRDVINPLRRGRQDLELAIDPLRAGLLGVAPADVDGSVRLAVTGVSAGEFRTADGAHYPVVLRAAMTQRPDTSTLIGLHLPSRSGAQIPLAQLGTLRLKDAPAGIERIDRSRAVIVTSYVQEGYNTAKVTRAVAEQLERLSWPPGYRLEVAGEFKSGLEVFQGLGAALLVAIFGIFAVLVLEFGSFKSTLIVGTVIPLGAMGGLLALWLTGYTLSFTAMVGFIALIGIEIKNSILLVDFTDRLRREGKPLNEAIAEAGEIRFLPVFLTSLTAIGGLLPLALQGSALYSPLACVIIGGLVSSTLIGRLVTPVMYKLLPPRIEADAGGVQPSVLKTELQDLA